MPRRGAALRNHANPYNPFSNPECEYCLCVCVCVCVCGVCVCERGVLRQPPTPLFHPYRFICGGCAALRPSPPPPPPPQPPACAVLGKPLLPRYLSKKTIFIGEKIYFPFFLFRVGMGDRGRG